MITAEMPIMIPSTVSDERSRCDRTASRPVVLSGLKTLLETGKTFKPH